MIVKGIKSFSDVITNSSNEVFVMDKCCADGYKGICDECIDIDEIDWDWVCSEKGHWEWEMVCDVCGIDPAVIRGEAHTDKYWGTYYDDPSMEDWEVFCEEYKDVINEKLVGLYWVDIEDHFADACEVSEDARSDSKWSDYRH